jgi:hypothetical protein
MATSSAEPGLPRGRICAGSASEIRDEQGLRSTLGRTWAATYDGQTSRLYVNGAQVASKYRWGLL